VVTQQSGNKAATIGNDTVLEVNIRDGDDVQSPERMKRYGSIGPQTLPKVSSLGAQNGIDLSTMAFRAHTTLGYSPNNNNTGGTLSITNGPQSASIALLGSYMRVEFCDGERQSRRHDDPC
jgi:hypothetical protein